MNPHLEMVLFRAISNKHMQTCGYQIYVKY